MSKLDVSCIICFSLYHKLLNNVSFFLQLFVWNQHSTQPVLRYSEHTAAVKAIAWSPHLHGLLASGGGTADRCIRFWNTTTNSQLGCMDTGSQVSFPHLLCSYISCMPFYMYVISINKFLGKYFFSYHCY